jgi:hypothetical protein
MRKRIKSKMSNLKLINPELFEKYKLSLKINNNTEIFTCEDCRFYTKSQGCQSLTRDIIFVHQLEGYDKVTSPSLTKNSMSDSGWCISVYDHKNRVKN